MFSKWPIQSIIHVCTWISTKMAILLDLAQRTLINITELDTNSCLKNKMTLKVLYLLYSVQPRDKRATEIDWNLWYAIFFTLCSIVYKYCTQPIRRHLYSGIFKDPFDRKYKIFKNRQNLKMICSMFKIVVFL